MMKKILVILMILLLPAAFAQVGGGGGGGAPQIDTSLSGAVSADSFLYGIDVALDNIRYALTLNPESKARVGLEIAQERLAEIQLAVDNNNDQAAQRATAEFESNVARAVEASARIESSSSQDELLAVAEVQGGVRNLQSAFELVLATADDEAKPYLLQAQQRIETHEETVSSQVEIRSEEYEAESGLEADATVNVGRTNANAYIGVGVNV